MQKKGQITAFVIIGILVLAGVAFYIYAKKGPEREVVPPQMAAVKIYADKCLQEVAEGAVLLAGVQGGVIYFGDVIPNVETFYSYSTYWYDKGQDKSISQGFIEGELSRYIAGELDSRCAEGFSMLQRNIERGNVTAEVKIKEGVVEFSVDWPITLVESDSRTTISKFYSDIPVKFGKAIEIANKVVQMEIADPDYVQLSELNDMEMMVVPYKYSDDIMIYSVIDEDNTVKGLDFKLIFANRFGNESSGNRDPKILNADNLLFMEGLEADYKFVAFDADNDALTWYSTGDFDVAEDGTLKFTPTAEDVGEHSVTIIAEDGKGGRDSQTIDVLVVGAG